MQNSYTVDVHTRVQADAYQSVFDLCPLAPIQASLAWSDIITAADSCPQDMAFFLVAKRCRKNEDHPVPVGGLPLYLFEGKFGSILTSVPYAGPLGGVFVLPDIDMMERDYIYSLLFDKAKSLAQELHCVSLTIISNPFLRDEALYDQVGRPTYVLENFCQFFPLSSITYDENNKIGLGSSSLNNCVRKNLKKSKAANVHIRWGNEEDFEEWYAIHKKRHNELNAIPLSKSFLGNILKVLHPQDKAGLVIAEIEGKIVGGSIFIWNKHIADCFILSTCSEFQKYCINYAITDFAIQELKKRNVHLFNWQSCRRGSGVYDFKKLWGSQESKYLFATWIFEGFNEVLSKTAQEISQEYPWHYVLPFEALEKRLNSGYFIK